MPRKWPSFSELFYPPFTEDVEELLARFQDTECVRYEAFSSIWRDMRFSEVFFGFSGMSEMKRFARLTLATAVKYFLPPYSYQIRVGGLYLMYGLYHTQLAIPNVNIRIALKDWRDVETFLKDSVNTGHYDVVYIYKKLVAQKAILYTAMPHFLCYRKHMHQTREPVCEDFVARSTVVQDLLSADILEELSNIQCHYEKMKADMPEVHPKASMTHRDFANNLKDCMSDFIVWQNKTFSQVKCKHQAEKKKVKEEVIKYSASRAQLLSSIKQKTYGNVQEVSQARRHRPIKVASDCKSEVQDFQTSGTSCRKRPISLFRRTEHKLGVTQTKKQYNNWLLTIPENIPDDRTLAPMHFIP